VGKLASDYSGRAIVAKLNTDLAQRTSQSFHIRGIPTSVVFVKGKEIMRQTGAVPYPTLASMIDKAAAA
jgi:thioredoxin-like negative regulator of GroEL